MPSSRTATVRVLGATWMSTSSEPRSPGGGMQDDVVGCLRDGRADVVERLTGEVDRFRDTREGGADQRNVLGLVVELQANVWRPGRGCDQSGDLLWRLTGAGRVATFVGQLLLGIAHRKRALLQRR